MSSTFSLEEYKIQREYRENKRKEYLRRFEVLKQRMPIGNNSIVGNNLREAGKVQAPLVVVDRPTVEKQPPQPKAIAVQAKKSKPQ